MINIHISELEIYHSNSEKETSILLHIQAD